jgi:hypothetical protein
MLSQLLSEERTENKRYCIFPGGVRQADKSNLSTRTGTLAEKLGEKNPAMAQGT